MATEPQLLGRFIHDPDAAMQEAELSGEDKSALRSGLPGMIYARLSGVPIKEAFVIRAPIPQLQLQLPLQIYSPMITLPPTIMPIYPPPTIAPIFPPPTVMPIFPIYQPPSMQIYSQPYYGWGR
jgi:hypothetical protein